jgi:Na+/melibiose symporter-like transporter
VTAAAERTPSASAPFPAKLAFASPGLPIGALNFLALTLLPAFYARNTAATLAEIGLVLLVSRIFDGVFHPLIGFASDLTAGRIGRKPWVVAGAFLSAPAAYFLFTPPSSAGPIYFAEWLILLFAAWTALEIPHRAWGAELSRAHTERASIFALLAQGRMLGSVLFVAAPLLPFFAAGDITSPHFMKWAAYGMGAVLPITAVVAVTLAPSGTPVATKASSLRGLIRSLRGNKPFWLFAVVLALTQIGSGLYNSLLLLFLTNYLHIGKLYPYLGLLYFAVALVSISVWSLVLRWVSKPKAWAASLLVVALMLPFSLMIEPGPDAFRYLLVVTVVFAFGASATYALPIAMTGDIVDYDILKTRENRSGAYFALVQFVMMCELAIGTGLGYLILDWLGYNPKGVNSDFANLGLKVTVFVLPAVFYVICALLIARSPITRRRHEIIRRRIEARAARLAAMAGP